MSDKNKELSLIYLIIALTALTVVSALFSVLPDLSFLSIILASTSTILVACVGVCADVMVRMKKWEWATTTERFKDGSTLRSLKLSILGLWGVCIVVCAFCMFIMTITSY